MKDVFRKQYLFWLDTTIPQEDQIADVIDELKERRQFAKTIRDGIRLVNDLANGRVDVLLELFPWVKAALQESAANQQFAALIGKAASQPLDTAALPSLFVAAVAPITPAESRENFAAGLGNLFAADDDEDLWDD